MSVNLYNATTDTLKNVAGDIVNPKSVNNTIAPTEETTTASRAYNIGEQFFLNDVLYKATANIVQGDTITVGTNCSASDKLTEQIDDKQDKTDNSLTTTAKTVVGAINEVKDDLANIDDTVTYLENNLSKLGKGTHIISGNFIAIANPSGTRVTIDLLKDVADDVTNMVVNNLGVILFKVTGGSTQTTSNEQAYISDGKISIIANTTTFSALELGYARVALHVTLS